MWSGAKPWSNFEFETPELDDKGDKVKKSVPAIWLTNIEHGRRHQLLQPMTAVENLRLSKHSSIKDRTFEEAYPKYDNYDAINVDFTDAIPEDYDGVMGVPISFLDKYCPEQFEIVGLGIANLGLDCGVRPYLPEHKEYRKKVQKRGTVDGDLYMIDSEGHPVVPYARILIRRK
jgi:hypothetical protein